MKILVTGTAGFIGGHLANALVNKSYEVVGLDQINNYYDKNIKYGRLQVEGIISTIEEGESIPYGKLLTSTQHENYKFIKLDLEDKESLMKIFEEEKFDAVCNLAAQAGVRYSLSNPNDYIQSNIIGFMNILEACRYHNVNNLSYASSSSVYGLNKEVPFSTNDNVDHPISVYAATKKSNELMAHTYSHLFGIATTGVRFFTVYGPWGRPDMAPFLFTKAALNNKPINVFNNGDMARDFTYIDDIVNGLIKIIENPAKAHPKWNHKDTSISTAPYKIYNIGNNNPVKLLEFINAIEKKLGLTIEKNMLPIQPGDVQTTFADVSDLVEDLDYKPNTPIQEGVNRFIDWYLEFFQIEQKK